jgi:hypothetical protein
MLSVKMNRQRNPKRIEKLETEMSSWAVVWSQEFMATEKELLVHKIGILRDQHFTIHMHSQHSRILFR